MSQNKNQKFLSGKEVQNFDLSYLIPPEKIKILIKHNQNYIKEGENEHHIRRIFNLVEYDEFENNLIQQLEHEIKKQNIVIPQNWTRAKLLMLVYSGDFHIQKCIENVKNHILWLNDPQYQTLTDIGSQMLQQGLFLQIGRDKQFRPIIVVNLPKINKAKCDPSDIINAASVYYQMIKKVMFVPGYVENWIIIYEFENMSLFSIPLKMLQSMINIFSLNFSGHLNHMYISNPPFILKSSWGLIQKMMHPQVNAKTTLITKDNLKPLWDAVDKDQLLPQYGGTLQELTQFFPPKNTLNPQLYEQKKEQNTKSQATQQNVINAEQQNNQNVEFYSIITEDDDNGDISLERTKKEYFKFEKYFTQQNLRNNLAKI